MSLNPQAMSFVPGQSFNPSLRRSSAAKTMQKTFRGHKSRRDLTRKKDAASRIQSRVRGYRSRTGKGEKWGLPYPQSRRDLDFDPKLQRRIFEESMYGRTRGLDPIREDIDLHDLRIKDYIDELSEIKKEVQDKKSMYNLGKLADEKKKERYYKHTADKILKKMYDMRDHPEKWAFSRNNPLNMTLYEEQFGKQPEIDIIRNILRDKDKTQGVGAGDDGFGARHEVEAIAEIEDTRQKYYFDMDDRGKAAITNQMTEEEYVDYQEKQLDVLEQLDIFKCKDIKAMAQADVSLFLDKEFLENKIRPCRDELTKIYIDTYYTIPYQVIWPDSKVSIEQMLNGMVKKGNFSKGAATAMTDTLMTTGIWLAEIISGHHPRNWLQLSQFYRFAFPGAQTNITHLPGNSFYIHGTLYDENRGQIELSGREALEYTLDLFEDTVRSRRLRKNRQLMTDDDIEKMKRYFILCLIGFKTPVGGESESINYLSKLTNLIDDAELLWQRRGEDKTKLLLDKLELIRFNVEKYMMS